MGLKLTTHIHITYTKMLSLSIGNYLTHLYTVNSFEIDSNI